MPDAQKEGLIVFLAGLRPEIRLTLERVGIAQRLGESFIFPEQEKDYSATLSAIRAAYGRLDASQRREAGAPVSYLV